MASQAASIGLKMNLIPLAGLVSDSINIFWYARTLARRNKVTRKLQEVFYLVCDATVDVAESRENLARYYALLGRSANNNNAEREQL